MAKILIVSKQDDQVYVYTEDLIHHQRIVQGKFLERLMQNRVPFSVFENECNVNEALKNGEWTSAIVSTDETL